MRFYSAFYASNKRLSREISILAKKKGAILAQKGATKCQKSKFWIGIAWKRDNHAGSVLDLKS